MRRFAAVVLVGFVMGWMMAGMGAGRAEAVTFYEDLAAHWAPDFYQDVNATYGLKADSLTNFDYDGDWNGRNNWENLNSYNTPAYVYYSVVETETHYFIGYYTFHARDDGPLDADKHENDLEGALVVIHKNGTTYGAFHLVETLAHDQWYQYTNDSAVTTGLDNVDGGVLFRGDRPKLFIQANGQSPWNGHGVHAYDGSGAPGGDGIVYQYTGVASVPTDGTGSYTHTYTYALKSVDELWNRREQIGNDNTFASFGVFRGDNYQANSAKAPWGWDDSDDGATFTGDIFSDPAHFVDTHLNGLGIFSHVYTYHPYYTHKIDISAITSRANRDPFGGASDIFPKVTVAGMTYTDDRLWKYNDSAVGAKRTVNWGYNNAADGAQYSSAYHTRHVAKPNNSVVTIEILDSDGTSGNDSMGTLSVNLAPGQSQTWTDAYTSNSEAQVTATVSRP